MNRKAMASFFGCCIVAMIALGIWKGKQSIPLSAQSSVPVTTKLLVMNMLPTKAHVSTDLGAQISELKGQIALKQTSSSSGQISLQLQSFNLLGSSVRTRLGPSGPFSLHLKRKSAITREFNQSSGNLKIELELVFQYELLGRLKGGVRTGNDHIAPLSETLIGQYDGQFQMPVTSQATSNSFDGGVRLQLNQRVLGGILGMVVDFPPLPVEIRPNFSAIGERTVALQPIFFRRDAGDGEPTGRDTHLRFMDEAQSIWAKCCVTLVELDPIYVDLGQYKVLTVSAQRHGEHEDVDMLNDPAIQALDDDFAIEVFYVRSFDPPEGYGGGITNTSLGLRLAKIIIADNNLDQNPASERILAHELGHAFGLCHPNARGCADLFEVPGSTGTVMCGSGFDDDNLDTQSAENCANSVSPLLWFSRIWTNCRPRGECLNSNDCGACQ